jgi:hypothetical protein
VGGDAKNSRMKIPNVRNILNFRVNPLAIPLMIMMYRLSDRQ